MFMCTRFWNEDFLKSLSSKGVSGSKLDEVVVFRKSFFEHFLNWNVIREKPKKKPQEEWENLWNNDFQQNRFNFVVVIQRGIHSRNSNFYHIILL